MDGISKMIRGSVDLNAVAGTSLKKIREIEGWLKSLLGEKMGT